MGQPMVRRLLQAGFPVTVFNRTRAKAEALQKEGARVASTAKEALEQAEAVILMLTDTAAVLEVLFGSVQVDFRQRTFIQMGTIAPRESRNLSAKIKALGGDYFECPVLGSRKEAAAGGLILMTGGTREQFERWTHLLRCFGPEPYYVGDVGQAATLKLALNQLIASLISTFSLSLGMVQKQGLDSRTLMSVLRSSALHAPMFDKKLPRLEGLDFRNPNFPVKHLKKDVDLILDECRRDNLDAAHLEGVRRLFGRAIGAGYAEEDYSALFKVIRALETADKK